MTWSRKSLRCEILFPAVLQTHVGSGSVSCVSDEEADLARSDEDDQVKPGLQSAMLIWVSPRDTLKLSLGLRNYYFDVSVWANSDLGLTLSVLELSRFCV